MLRSDTQTAGPLAQDFLLSSEDCRLLLLLETTGSVRRAAQMLHRDVSVISRKVSRLSQTTSFLEKVDGHWRVSDAGRRMNAWTQDAMLSQRSALKERTLLRIATTHEFSARVLAPRLSELLEALAPGERKPRLSIQVAESGVEALLLSGTADLGIDCGRPRDPLLRFERAVDEPFEVVAAPAFFGKQLDGSILGRLRGSGLEPKSLEELLNLPHLHFSRFPASTALKLTGEVHNVLASFNDLASIRGAAIAGLGWAVVPRYTVVGELASGALAGLQAPWLPKITPERFGVWWLSGREALQPWARRMANWLRKQKL